MRGRPLRWLVLAVVAATVAAGCGHPPAARVELSPARTPEPRVLPPRAKLPSGAACAQRVRKAARAWEPRPENRRANRTMPGKVRLPDWGGMRPPANQKLKPRIDGRFTGTTDQILQWASCKWGFDPDLTRAIAKQESDWRQSRVGDFERDKRRCVGGYQVPCPTSFGILQIKHFHHPGTYPSSARSTAFNVDYVLGLQRACYEGLFTYLERGYRAGDLWGCVGRHYSGHWKDPEARRYIAKVQRLFVHKPWRAWRG